MITKQDVSVLLGLIGSVAAQVHLPHSIVPTLTGGAIIIGHQILGSLRKADGAITTELKSDVVKLKDAYNGLLAGVKSDISAVGGQLTTVMSEIDMVRRATSASIKHLEDQVFGAPAEPVHTVPSAMPATPSSLGISPIPS